MAALKAPPSALVALEGHDEVHLLRAEGFDQLDGSLLAWGDSLQSVRMTQSGEDLSLRHRTLLQRRWIHNHLLEHLREEVTYVAEKRTVVTVCA
jgi:hypothetical protein